MTRQMPTADEVARIVIASFRTAGADPLRCFDRLSRGWQPEYQRRIVHGRQYAVLAVHRLFPSIMSGPINRMLRCSFPSFAAEVIREVAQGKARWFDETDFRAILARCGVEQREREQTVVDETGPEPRISTEPAPVPQSLSSGYPVRVGAKKRLEDELRQAVENTARMQQADEGEIQ